MSTPATMTAAPVSAPQIQQIEDGLLAQLAAAFTNPGDARPWLKVESWPTRSEGYRLTGVGDVFTIYKGRRFESNDTSSAHYEAKMQFEITLRARTLRDQQAAYAMIDCAYDAVCGKRVSGSSGVTLAVRDDFVDAAEGVFAYALVVEVPVFMLQSTDDASGPWVPSGDPSLGTPIKAPTFNYPGV
jgi:hypothetical protein